MPHPSLTVEAVLAALKEHDELGRSAFLDLYGFKGARDYFLAVDGKNYDSKAIVAVAHKYLADGQALKPSQLSGGISDAAGKLKALGFTVTKPGENADWTWDEHVLALELYMSNPVSPPGKQSKQVNELSELLNRLGERLGVARTLKFRNANGVYMKMMNFRRVDPAFQALGKTGLNRGNKLEVAVWNEFADDLDGLRAAAKAVRLAIADDTVEITAPLEEYEADEGALILKLHKSRERDRKLIKKKKDAVLTATGKLVCEVCDFDFLVRYGDHGRGYIEAHHRKPVSTLKKGDKTKLTDLALVCANCHRMLHRRKMLLDVDALKSSLSA